MKTVTPMVPTLFSYQLVQVPFELGNFEPERGQEMAYHGLIKMWQYMLLWQSLMSMVPL